MRRHRPPSEETEEGKPMKTLGDPIRLGNPGLWEHFLCTTSFLPNSNRLISAAGRHGAQIFDIECQDSPAVPTIGEGKLLGTHPDGKLVGLGGERATVWDIESNQRVSSLSESLPDSVHLNLPETVS